MRDLKEGYGDSIIEGFLTCLECDESFKIEDGLANLIFPKSLEETFRSIEKFYDERPFYDYRPTAFRFGIWSMVFQKTTHINPFVDRLALFQGANVLEVGAGTGRNLSFIAELTGESGRTQGMDISASCLKTARELFGHIKPSIELVQANASYLPYPNDTFDAILCVGGFNDFEEQRQALGEMHRAVKAGAKVVIVDEGLSPEREATFLGKYILKCQKVFDTKPPIELLPEDIEDLRVDWIYQGTFWILEYRKSSSA